MKCAGLQMSRLYTPRQLAAAISDRPFGPNRLDLLLAARAEGRGYALTTLLCVDEPAVRTLLQLPEDSCTCAHVPIGHPVGKGHGPISRRSVASRVFTDSFGAAS